MDMANCLDMYFEMTEKGNTAEQVVYWVFGPDGIINGN